MRFAVLTLGIVVGFGAIGAQAQSGSDQPQLTSRVKAEAPQPSSGQPSSTQPASAVADPSVTVPAGTKIPLIMKQGVTTKNARVGDPVYAQTAFPIVENDRIIIPVGTFVQGEVHRVLRPGRVKGRPELQMSFTSMIFPNGYTVLLPGAVHGTPGSQDTEMTGNEGTIKGRGDKGKDAATIAGGTLPGAGIGALAAGAKGAGIGAATGGVLGLATVLVTRGPDIALGAGSSVEMVLERSLVLEDSKMHKPAQ